MRDPVLTSQISGGRPWPCWIEIELDAISHNVRALEESTGAGCQLMAVVKAEAYGHGATVVARAAVEAGARWLGVARVREGVRLRAAGVSVPILVLGHVEAEEVGPLVRHELSPTVVSVSMARMISEEARRSHRRVPVHVKVNTGLSRYGVSLEEAHVLLGEMASMPNIEVEALYSHFATADEVDGSFAVKQLEAFRSARTSLERAGFVFRLCHMASSGGVLGVQGSEFDLVRIGISLYGVYPSAHLASRIALLPALSMHSRVARLLQLRPGDSVGYGRTFVASAPVTAALVPIGYADGLPRSHSNRGFLLVNGRRAPLIGRVSMDQCVVDVTHCGAVEIGAPVVAIGSQQGEVIGVDEFAERSSTISYEALTSLGYRVPRVYLRGGRVVAVAYLDEGTVFET